MNDFLIFDRQFRSPEYRTIPSSASGYTPPYHILNMCTLQEENRSNLLGMCLIEWPTQCIIIHNVRHMDTSRSPLAVFDRCN